MMAILGWIVLTGVGLYVSFMMVVISLFDGIFGATKNDRFEHIIGWLIAFGLLFLSYRYCPFSITLDK